MCRGPADPKIRELVGKASRPRIGLATQKPRANDDPIRVELRRSKQQGDVGGQMLTIAVERKNKLRASRKRPIETRRERRGLSPVGGVTQQRDWQVRDLFRRSIA